MTISSPHDFAPNPAALVDAPRWPTGIAALDAALAGGLAYGRLHEIYAGDADDAAAAAGFAALLAMGLCGRGSKSFIWLHHRRAMQLCGIMQGQGLAELGIAVQHCLFVQTEDGKGLLKAGLDAVRCGGLGAVILQGHGRMPELDLTASRRLVLAAQRSGVALLLLRLEAEPVPSAAETRWLVRSAPSVALAAQAPGLPCFDIELLRQRAGPCGMGWRLEWDRDQAIFRDAALSGAVVPLSTSRPLADPRGGDSSGTGLAKVA